MSALSDVSEISLFAEQPDLARLLGALRRAQGFALYFARCNSPAFRNRLVEALQSRLQRPVVHIDLSKAESASLDAFVETALESAPSDAVAFLYNLECFLPSDDLTHREQTMRQLNWRRGFFSRQKRPFVFWLPEYALNLLANGAPDFYDWYSGVYEFETKEASRSAMEMTQFLKLWDYSSIRGLSLEEKGRWAEVLEELIEETREENETERQNRVALIYRAGILAFERADYPTAKSYFERALKIHEAAYGPEHPNVGTDLNNLGIVLQELGDLQDAKQAFEHALKIHEAAYGSEHPDMAMDLNNLGNVMKELGDLQGAKQAYERALKIYEAAYGPEHPSMGTDLNNLGVVQLELGDLQDAKQAFEHALKIHEAAYGSEHPDMAIDLNNLGNVMKEFGELQGAKQAYERALKIDEVAYGLEHPNVARDLYNLGILLREAGDLQGAKQVAERAIKIYRRFLGDMHPYTKGTETILKLVLTELGEKIPE